MMRMSVLLCLALTGCLSCSGSVARSAAILRESVDAFADASEPARNVAGVTTEEWLGLRDAVRAHARELEARARE